MFNFRRFLALFRPQLYTPLELAMRDLAQGRCEEALARLDVLFHDPSLRASDRAAAANKRGVALVQLERRHEARAAFGDALALVAEYAPALVNIGSLHFESGETENAIAYYQRAIAADEQYALAHHNLGVAYKRLGRTGDAVRELRRAHRLEGRGGSTSPNRPT